DKLTNLWRTESSPLENITVQHYSLYSSRDKSTSSNLTNSLAFSRHQRQHVERSELQHFIYYETLPHYVLILTR
ncbi:hypothetical protein J6590_106722, partial [Homalodisca vitripennis]